MLESLWVTPHHVDSPGGSDNKESVCNAGDLGSTPGLERYPGERMATHFCQYSCLENSMGRGTWQATVHGVTKSWIRLSDNTFSFSTICSWKILAVIGLGMGMWQASQRGTSQVLLVDFLERKGFLIPKKEAHEKLAPSLELWVSCGWIWLLPLWPSGHTWSHSQHAKGSTEKQGASLNYCVQ